MDAASFNTPFLHTLFAVMPDGISVVDPYGVHVQVNDALCAMTGFSQEELLGAGLPHPYWPPEQYDTIQEAFTAARAGTQHEFDLVFQRKDGERFPVIVTAGAIRDEQGTITHYFATVKDNTIRKRKHERYATVIEQAADAIMIADHQSRFLEVNRKAIEMLGFTRAELLEMTIPDIIPRQEKDHNPLQMDPLRQGKTVINERRLLCKDGTSIEVEIHSRMLSDGAFLGILRDISGRKKAERALRESEARLRSITDNALDHIILLDLDYQVLFINHTAPGLTVEDVQGTPIANFLPPESIDRVLTLFDRVQETREPATYFTNFHDPLGNLLYYESQVCPIIEDGQVVALAINARDITERRKARIVLQESEARYRALMEQSPFGIQVFDADGTLREVNKAWETMWVVPREQVIGHYNPLEDEQLRQMGLMEQVEQSFAGEVVHYPDARFDPALSGFSGIARWIRAHAYPLLGEDGGVMQVVVISEDVTSHIEANEQIEAMSRKLIHIQEEERRHLAQALHDEIGSLLTALQLSYHTSSEDSHALDETLLLLSELTGKVRNIATTLRPPALDEMGLIPAITHLFRRFTRHTGIRVDHEITCPSDFRFDPDKEITAYRLLQESLTNIARHAETDRVWIEVMVAAPTLRIQVKDDGRGFNVEEAIQRKTMGIMGMRERVALLGGTLTINSHPGQGTQVYSELPIASENYG